MGQLNDLLSGFFRRFINKIGLGFMANYILGQKGPVWISTEKPWLLYNTVPALKSVIDRKAMMFANMKMTLINITTKEPVDDKELMKLLENPNPLQGQNDWLKEFQIQKSTYGSQFMYGSRAGSLQSYPHLLWNISPRYCKPVLTGKLFDQTEIKGIISGYQLVQNGSSMPSQLFDPENIMYTKLPNLDDPIIGLSPIHSLSLPLSNIKASYEFRNVIMTQKGAIGMLSQEKPSNDGSGVLPMEDGEKDRMEKHFTNKYGIGPDQAKVLVTEASMKWTPMTYPTKELMLFEEVDADKRDIIDQYGMNQNIFCSLQGSTYENVKNSLVMVYQDTIQPEADGFCQMLSKFLRVKEGFKIIASYDHLSILKENKLSGMAAIKSMIEALTQAVQAGLLDRVQAENILAAELGVTSISEEVNGSKVSNRLNSLSPLVADKVLDQFTTNETRALAGLPTIAGGETIPVKTAPSTGPPKK